MIMKDNAHFLVKSLPALESLRKNVPSELIIVDTGSTDASKDVALKYTEKVVDFAWTGDFAAARNFGIAKCRGDWVLILDTDEVFADTTELEEFFNDKNKNGGYNSATYMFHNHFNATIETKEEDLEKETYTTIAIPRCFRRIQDGRPVMYAGSIHEYIPAENLYPLYEAKTYVNHFGYAYLTEDQKKLKNARNAAGLIAEEKKYPDDLRIAQLLINEDFDCKYEKSRVMLGRLCGIGKPYEESVCKQPLFHAIIKYYHDSSIHKEAVAASFKYFENFGKNNSVALNILYLCASSRFALGDFVGAYEDLQDTYRLYEDKKAGWLDESLSMHTQNNIYTLPAFETYLQALTLKIMYNTGMFDEAWGFYKKHLAQSDANQFIVKRIQELEESVQPLCKRYFLEELTLPYNGVQKNKILFPPLTEEETELAKSYVLTPAETPAAPAGIEDTQ